MAVNFMRPLRSVQQIVSNNLARAFCICFQASRPDCFVTTISRILKVMPGLSGLEVLRRVRQ